MRLAFISSGIYKPTFILFLAIILSGCSTLAHYRIASQQEIDQWVEANQYARALGALEYKAKLLPTKVSRNALESIKTRASEYDRQQAAMVLKLQNNDQWEEALSTLYTSLQNFPEGEQLRLAQKTMLLRQEKSILNLETQLLIGKAEWLSKSLKLYHNMLLVNPKNRDANWNMSNTLSGIRLTASKLHTLGLSALAKNEYDLAEICLQTANRLNPINKHAESVALLEQKTRKTTEEIDALLNQMKQAIENNRMKDGRKILLQLEKINEYPPEVVELKQILTEKINDEVARLLEEGNVLYKNDKLEEAKNIWRRALSLNPGNEQLLDRISRAERALETLKELKKADSKNRPEQKNK